MASLRKKPRSPYFYACFLDHSGRKRQRSTKETNRKRAQRIAEEFERAGRTHRTVAQVRRVLTSLHLELAGDTLPAVTVSDYSHRWLEGRRSEIAPRSFTAYEDQVRTFLSWLGERGSGSLEAITRAELVTYRDQRSAETSAATANNGLRVVRMIFRAAKRDGLIGDDPSENVPAVRERRRTGRTFGPGDIRAVMSVATPEWASMILFGALSGLRLSDIAGLTWQNIDMEAGAVRLVVRKTSEPLTVPLAPSLKEHLGTLGGSDDPGAPLHPRAADILARHGRCGMLSREFGEILTAAGLREPVGRKPSGRGLRAPRTDRGLKFHDLRATFVTALHEQGVAPEICRALAGHASDVVHRKYARFGAAALADAVGRLGDPSQ